MEIKEIFNELIHHKLIDNKQLEYKQLTGGTVSELYLLTKSDNTRLVVKLNEPQVTKAESDFLIFYEHLEILPKLLFVRPSYEYMVYSFVSGSTSAIGVNKREMLQILVQRLINKYKVLPNDTEWGWVDEPTDSWKSFLRNKILDAHQSIGSILEKDELNFVLNLVDKKNDIGMEPFLLHGDCGVHNFIFIDKQLSGVIDPSSIIGDPLYDLIYAFCSSPDDLSKETIDSAVSYLKVMEKYNTFVYEDVMIGLFLRIGTCIRHHAQDLEDYVKAWHYWKDIMNKI